MERAVSTRLLSLDVRRDATRKRSFPGEAIVAATGLDERPGSPALATEDSVLDVREP